MFCSSRVERRSWRKSAKLNVCSVCRLGISRHAWDLGFRPLNPSSLVHDARLENISGPQAERQGVLGAFRALLEERSGDVLSI